MKKNHLRLASLLLSGLLAVNLCAFGALADDAPAAAGGGAAPADMGAPSDGAGGGGNMSPSGGGDAAPSQAAIYIQDGQEVPANEYEGGAYASNISTDGGNVTIHDLDLTNGDYGFNGVVATGSQSQVILDKCKILLSVDSPVSSDATGGSGTAVDDGATMYIRNSELQVDGAARYVVSNYNDGTLVVNDSTVTSTGMNDNTSEIAEPFSNAALLISGNARANFSIGMSKTYYFNSTCTAEGWAALSTDSSRGDGLDLYAYNTDAVAQNGGYSTYADFGCRVWLYGSRLSSAEVGAIIAKSGKITVADGASAPDEVMTYNEGATTRDGTVLTGGRNAVMIHAPDMMGQGAAAADCGTLIVKNSTLATSKDLVSTKNYSDYSDAIGAYVDYVSGSDILLRSTSADITLDNATMESYSGVLVQTVLNSDSMGNFLAEGDADTEQVKPIAITMKDMDAAGDIDHMDYQRKMNVTLDNATLTGKIVSGTVDAWNALWKDYPAEDCNWVVNDSWSTPYGVSLTVGAGSTWTPTGESTLSNLTIADGGALGSCTMTVDGKDVTPEAGQTYTGEIVVTEAAAPAQTESPAETTEAAVSETPAAASEAPAETAASGNGPVIAIVIVLVVLAGAAAVVYARKKK